MGENGEGSKEYKLVVGGVKYSIRNIVSNILLTVCGVRWYEIYQDDHLVI